MNRELIEFELKRAAIVVKSAGESLQRQKAIDLDALSERIEEACTASRQLPVVQARVLLPLIDTLIDDLNRLEVLLVARAPALPRGAGD